MIAVEESRQFLLGRAHALEFPNGKLRCRSGRELRITTFSLRAEVILGDQITMGIFAQGSSAPGWGSDDEVVVFDGGMGTELYERGFYINRPFEELNLNAPIDVIRVHEDYIRAGAQMLTTNTFSITRPQLRNFDIQDQQAAIVLAAIKNANIARKNSGVSEAVQVGLSIGPLGEIVEPLGSFGLDDARSEFERVCHIVTAGAEKSSDHAFDAYLLETFTQISELEAAVEGIRRVDSVRPILASLSVKSSQNDILREFATRIGARSDVTALGLNCMEGPSDLLASLKKLRPLTRKPIVVQPNAGTPRQLNGRYFYMTSPDYMGKFAKRFIEAGATGVGGCCGTGPDHIRAIRSAARMMNSKREPNTGSIEVGVSSGEGTGEISMPRSPKERKSFAERPASRVSQILSAGKKVISIEMVPPKGTDTKKFFEGAEKVAAAGIPLINIPDGARAMTRISSLHMAAQVQMRMQGRLCVIPHFTTRDRNLIALQSDLLGAFVNGVHDVLLVTGDPPKLGNNRDATAVYDIDAIGLTYLTDCLNRAVTPSGESLGTGTEFGIGVASNPTAVNLDTEIRRWNFKVESGADYSITQPIFDAESFFRWREKITATYRPHIVGIWPLVSLRNAEFMKHEVPGVHVPDWVITEMEKAGDSKEEAIKRGIEIARRTMEQLSSACEGFCVSAPLGKVEVALDALKP